MWVTNAFEYSGKHRNLQIFCWVIVPGGEAQLQFSAAAFMLPVSQGLRLNSSPMPRVVVRLLCLLLLAIPLANDSFVDAQTPAVKSPDKPVEFPLVLLSKEARDQEAVITKWQKNAAKKFDFDYLDLPLKHVMADWA